MKITEELKEALLRSKGQKRAMILMFENGEWIPSTQVYTMEESDEALENVKLKAVKLEEPSPETKAKAKEIVGKLSQSLHGTIEDAVYKALIEKSPAELALIAGAAGKPEGRVERRRGCFWLVTPESEIVL
jgi:hypothetical protein